MFSIFFVYLENNKKYKNNKKKIKKINLKIFQYSGK